MIHVGTCSWTEKSLIESGEFYSKGIKTAEGRLRYYASQFNTVEVDSSYYAIPNTRNAQLWAERTPDDFIFHIKAYGALTGHGIDIKTLPRDIYSLLPEKDRNGKKYVYIKEPFLLNVVAERFCEALYPLSKAKKLGMLVYQFPPWFRYSSANFDFVLQCKELMKGQPIAIEFRHGSWLTPDVQDKVLHFLRKYQLTYIPADEPQYGNLATVPFVPHTTTDIAYFRFHGRNKENWLKKGIETSLRYSYDYPDNELQEFINPLKNAEKRAKVTYAMFNNCHGGFAMKNAHRMKEMLTSKETAG